jgi:ubiquinone/menaquinone biosynthesis C-methylase UbiE
LPFLNQFFDVITAIAVLEHLFNPPMMMKEINRVLKPLGVFIMQVPNIA